MEQATRIIFVIPDDLLARVDDYRFAGRHQSRSEALRQLLTVALDQQEAKEGPST
jgi:metal-responsive CopG/Arc/MetJ family transcriptional regulator